ncbi:unnamed protein product [Gongylonema pulchrum]|uniref:Transposase n=1 Tax=Gongylonema pulchrum TaxID=637853 RepID=A0A183E0R5_9BILA|nr:unnamed protein product [Gongylonema pulchrum]
MDVRQKKISKFGDKFFYRLDKYPYYVEREWWKDGNRMTFWSTWRMKRDVKRRQLLAELGPDRVRLKALKSNILLPKLITDECAEKLHNFPKGSCPCLVQHLCQFSGARRGKLNRFHLHRQIFRLANFTPLFFDLLIHSLR